MVEISTAADINKITEMDPDNKYEIINGQIYMMGRASIDHGILTTTIATLLNIQFKGKPCRVIAETMGIKINTRDNSVLPDVVVVCGKIDRSVSEIDNPALIVEVLSKSTEGCDRGDKLNGYMSLNSLKAYLIVDKELERIEMYRRINDEIIFDTFTTGDILEIDDWVVLSIDDIYNELKDLDRE